MKAGRGNDRGVAGAALVASGAVLGFVAAGAPAQAGPNDPFTLVMIPDTQYYAQEQTGITSFHVQTQWIVDQYNAYLANPATGKNVAFVSHVGDIVNNGWNDTQWSRALGAMATLKNSPIPFGLAPGNHDEWETKPPVTYAEDGYHQHFGPDYFAGKTWYKGSSTSKFSNYQTFTGGGREYVVIHLEVNAPQAELDWAQGVINANPGKPVILSTHEYMGVSGRDTSAEVSLNGRNSGEQIWQKFVKKNDQIFMVISGHNSGHNQQRSFNDYNHEVIEVLADYQSMDEWGNGFLRTFDFNPVTGKVTAQTYSPTLGRTMQSQDDGQLSGPNGVDGAPGEIGAFHFYVDLDARFGNADSVKRVTWQAGSAGNFSDATKWTDTTTGLAVTRAPGSGLTAMTFGGSSSYTATSDLGLTLPPAINQLVFNNTAGTVTLGGSSTIATTGGINTLATPTITESGAGKVVISAPLRLNNHTIADIADELSITSQIRGNNTNLIKNGVGTLILGGGGGFFTDGDIDLNAGTIRLGNNDKIGSRTVVDIASGATLDDSYGDGEGFAGMTGTGLYLGRNNANLALGENNQNATFDGKITAGTSGVIGATPVARQLRLQKTGTGTITLTNATSDFAGQTQVILGTLSLSQIPNRDQNSAVGLGDMNNVGNGAGVNLGADFAIGDTAATPAAATAVILKYTGASASTDRRFATVGNGGTLEISSAATNFQLNGAISGTGTLVKAGAGTLTLNVDAAAPMGVTAGKLVLAASSPTEAGLALSGGSIETAPGSGTTYTFGKDVSGTGVFTKKGAGTLELTTTASFAGGVDLRVDEGTLRTAKSSPIGDANTITIAAGATWNDSWGNGERIGGLNGAGTYIARVGSNQGLNIGGGAINSTFSGKITAGTDGVIGTTNSARNLNWFNKLGSGTLTLTGAQNDFQVRVHIQDGTISIDSLTNRGQPSPIGTGFTSNTPDLTIGTSSKGATFKYTGASAVTDRRIELSHATGSIIDITNAGTSLTVGIASSTGGLTKNGPGTLVLGANNTYTGATTVNQGTLQSNGTLATSSIYVKQGSSLNLNNPSISRSIPVTLETGANLSIAAAGGGAYDGISSRSAALSGMIGSTASLLDGTNGSSSPATVNMSWRARSAGEQATGPGKLFSDVLNLSGITSTGGGATDLFVLSMSYNPAELGAHPETQIGLTWLDGSAWVNAVDGNVGGSARFTSGAFVDAGLPGLADDLGRWGVDAATDTVWAVLNHNSSFGVGVVETPVPEPGTIGLLLLAAPLLLRRQRRRQRRA